MFNVLYHLQVKRWEMRVSTITDAKLEQSLLVESDGKLCTNFDPLLVRLLRETKYFLLLKVGVLLFLMLLLLLSMIATNVRSFYPGFSWCADTCSALLQCTVCAHYHKRQQTKKRNMRHHQREWSPRALFVPCCRCLRRAETEET